MSRLLVCLFTFNRPALMLNAARSIDRFLPGSDGVVFDDGSWVPGSAEALEQVRRDFAGWDFRARERGTDIGLQGLYRNMADALALAVERGYEHCLFIEDDTQLVWQKPGQLNELDALFAAAPDAVQVQPLLYRRLHDYREAMEYVRSAGMYRCVSGFNTTAFWNMRVVREHPDYRVVHTHGGSNLPLNSAAWLKRGYRLYADPSPNMGIIPWVRSHSAAPWETTGMRREAVAGDGLLLRPLSPDAVKSLCDQPAIRPVTQESFDLSAENCGRPIWHRRGELMGLYYRRCREAYERETAAGDGKPLPVSAVRDVASCRLGPKRSHLDWRQPMRPATARPGMRKRVAAFLPRWVKAAARHGLAQAKARLNGDYRAYRMLRRRMREEQARRR